MLCPFLFSYHTFHLRGTTSNSFNIVSVIFVHQVLVNADIDLYIVKEILGHSSIQVTEKYAHLAPHKLSDAVAVLESL